MDVRRIFLYLALGLILILIWTSWHSEHTPSPGQRTPSPSAATARAGATAGAGESAASQIAPAPSAAAGTFARPAGLTAPAGAAIAIHTDVLALTLTLDGATLTRAQLLQYAQSLQSKAPVNLLSPAPQNFLTVAPLMAGQGLPPTLQYRAGATSFALAPNAQTLVVPLVWTGNGLRVERQFILTRGSYAVEMKTEITNTTDAAKRFTPAIRILGRNPLTAEHFWQNFLPKYSTYRGPAYYNGDYNKRAAPSLIKNPLDKAFSGGWIVSVKRYFIATAIPPAKLKAHYFGRAVGDDGYVVGYRLPAINVDAGASSRIASTFYLGPKLQGHLNQVAPGLARTVDYGHATIISHPLFMILSFIEGLIGNWGWSIVILVLLIKAIFYFPQRMSARSMAKMRKLQPRLKLLKERYKDDKQKLSEATMKLYREEGANPVSGCLPMLIQIPIFFGLFYVLIYSVELRHAPWVLWIQDLSAPDPFYILPILFAAVTLVQLRLQPQSADNAQAKMMMVMPLVMAFLYAIFPAGLVLYYLVNTLLNIAIQWQVNHKLGIPLNLWPKRKPKTESSAKD